MADHDLASLLSSTILPEMRRMAYDCAQYLSYGQIAVGIELFGACLDAQPVEKPGLSRKRFESGVLHYMVKVDSRYGKYVGAGSPYDLYVHLRCGMAHILRPQGKVGFTGRIDAVPIGIKHLEVYVPLDKLVLVAQDFFDDFEKAAQLFIADIPHLDQRKVAGVFLPVHELPSPSTP